METFEIYISPIFAVKFIDLYLCRNFLKIGVLPFCSEPFNHCGTRYISSKYCDTYAYAVNLCAVGCLQGKRCQKVG